MHSKIINFHNIKEPNLVRGSTLLIPVFETPVWAGDPTDPPDMGWNEFSEYLEIPEEFVKNPDHTYAHRVKGDSMEPTLYEGDKLLIDCSDSAKYGGVIGKMVLVYMEGGYNVKRLKIIKNKLWVVPDNPRYPSREVTAAMNFEVKGLVIGVIEIRRIE